MKNLAAIVSLLALLATPQFLAGAPDTVFLEDLTWPELRAFIETGRVTTIILPIGGTEQSGPHMALGKHNVWSPRRQRRSRWAWNRRDSNGAQRSFEAASAAAADPDALTKIRQGLAGSFAFTFGTVSAFFGLRVLALGFAGLASEDKGANGLGLFLVFLGLCFGAAAAACIRRFRIEIKKQRATRVAPETAR